jgi:hypothetical protein
MAKKIGKADVDKEVQDQIRNYNLLVELQRKEYEGLTHIFNLESQRAKTILDMQKAENERNVRFAEYKELQEAAAKGQIALSKVTLTAIEKQLKREQDKIVKLKTQEKILKSISSIKFPDFMAAVNAIGSAFNDKPIRETILQLGLGAEKGQGIRDAFYQALPKAAQLGANMKDLAQIQQGYTEETGRAVALTGQQLVNITEIGKGTGVGIQHAAKLVAQFELLGMSTQKSQETIQGIVDTTERMGVNTTKVLKNVSENFKRLNTFAFKDGVKGMAKMASYAEKFRIDFDASINSADKARTLDGAIEMASQLQVLGGEFTKADPFELFHLSRNDPAKYTQKLNEMVKGMSQLVKTADGFKLQTSPQDLDRLKLAAEATGVPFENLVEQSEKFAEIQAMNKQLIGSAFSKEQRETIQAMAKLDSKSGIYKVLGKDISTLSAQEVEALKVQQKTLKERAEASQTFDEKFNNTIQSMKYTLLPILDGINAVFDTIHPYLKGIADWMTKQPPWAKSLLTVVGGGIGIALAMGKAGAVLKSIPGIGSIGKLFGGGATKAVASAVGGGGGTAAKAVGGGGGFGTGAGVGVAALGLGAGVGVAAAGISKLADSMAKLNKEQVDALETIAVTLAVSFPLAAIGVGILAAVAAPAAVPLLALGAAIFGIGAGVGIAAAGIGYMAEGFSKLLTAADPSKVFALAAGVAALGASMAYLAGGSILSLFAGGGAFAMLALLSTRADAFDRIGKSMREIGVVMNSNGEGLARLKETLDSIQNVSSNGGIFSELKDILSKPLKVEFKDKNVALNVNMTLELDSTAIAKKTAKKIVVLHNDYQQGKAG